ncbi:MAG TPA: hypothetical protein VFW77_01845 [Candidatus Saccharimonadales bacterium]|nr:hypothetical protein [Candidatus Saccharimonadales bacterium]
MPEQAGRYTAEKNLEAHPFPKSATFLARRIAGGVASRLPGPLDEILEISPRTASTQKVLSPFRGRFGVAGNILEAQVPDLDRRVAELGRLMVNSEMLDEKTLVELRILVPDSALYEGVATRGLARMAKLRNELADNHGITRVIPNGSPIIATAGPDSPVDCEKLWGMVADEFYGLSRQMGADSPPSHMGEPPNIAMVALAEDAYARHVFSGQIGFHPEYLDSHLMVMHHVAQEPRETLLVPAPASLS